MSKILNKCALTLIFLFIVGTAVPVRAQSPLGSTLYTTYQISSNHQTVSWIVCGSTQESEGCYGSGNLGPFGSVGALLEGIYRSCCFPKLQYSIGTKRVTGRFPQHLDRN